MGDVTADRRSQVGPNRLLADPDCVVCGPLAADVARLPQACFLVVTWKTAHR
jgi:hypothetical protein